MLDSGMLTRYYTYNALHYFFYDHEAVATGVLQGLNPNDRRTVLEDPYLGMNSIGTLLHWVNAAQTQDAAEIRAIQEYFLTARGVNITDT